MSLRETVAELVEAFSGQRRIRAGSLIITVYGDAIAPRGGTVWLGSLIRLLEGFGLNQRLVRTSVFRLARDGWLSAEQIGRRSYYSLTDAGRRRFESAYRRIYSGPHEEWDGSWSLVMTGEVGGRVRETLTKELKWQGFGTVAGGVLAHPAPDEEALQSTLLELEVAEEIIVMRARNQGPRSAPALRRLVNDSWDLEGLATSYRTLLERFRPVHRALQRTDEPDPETCFRARTLLIHEYRRVLLRDPKLPAELLPGQWAGTDAYRLCRNIYRALWRPSERFLSESLETADGPLPEPASYFYRRFGGL